MLLGGYIKKFFLYALFLCFFVNFTFVQAQQRQQAKPKLQANAMQPTASGGRPVQTGNVKVGNTSTRAWMLSDKDKDLFFAPQNGKWTKNAKGEIFADITYLDNSYAKINALLETDDGNWIKPSSYTQIYMMNTGSAQTACFKFSGLEEVDIKSIKINLERTHKHELAIVKASFTDNVAALNNPYFGWLVEEGWRRPYAGPESQVKDNKTIKGKVMTGYQGWFATPNDALDRGWVHWGNVPKGELSVDGLPYIKDYPMRALEKACDMKTASGKPLYLFSSANPEVVMVHFQLMKKYNIDGAYLQRFVSSGSYGFNKREEWVMANVRDAANRTGRVWAVEWDASGGGAQNRYNWEIAYDVSGGIEETVYEKISADWKWMIDSFGIKQDKSYAREGNKLVVFVWGMELRDLPIEDCDRVLNFLKHDPKYGNNYFIGGMSGGWKNKPHWREHLQRHDALLIWHSGRYAEDIKEFAELLPGVEYLAHVHPGFSWANLKHIQTNSYEAFTDREDGAFMQGRIDRSIEAGSKMSFVGMYDEYDEATMVLPLSDDNPEPPCRPGAVVFYARPGGEHNPPLNLKPEVYMKFGTSPHKSVGATDFYSTWATSIQIPADGEYTFSLVGAPGDSYKIHSSRERILSENFIDPDNPKTYKVSLKKGFMYPLKIEYNHKDGAGEMYLVWEGPRIKKQRIPDTAQFDSWGRFLTNEGKSPYLYLEISSKIKEALKKNLKN